MLCCIAQSVPNLINYQGRLTDQTGAALPQGLYQIQFRLWDSPTATNTSDLIWAQQQNITVQSNGVFNVILGSPGGTPPSGTTPLVSDLSAAFAQTNRFLGVEVVSSNGVGIQLPSEIIPRQQMLSVPFAIAANTALNAVNGVPPGSIISFGGSQAPSGWLVCDGSTISRSTYSNLFAAVNTTYGIGDGATTFALPNLKGRVPVGYDIAEPEFNPIGMTGGGKTHTLTIAEMPAHGHSISVNDTTIGSAGSIIRTDGNAAITGSQNSGMTGGGQAHNILQPYIALIYISLNTD